MVGASGALSGFLVCLTSVLRVVDSEIVSLKTRIEMLVTLKLALQVLGYPN